MDLQEKLFKACSDGHLPIVKYLHEHGADITADDNSAIQWAVGQGHLETVKWLHQNGADIKARDNLAVINAFWCGHLDVIKYLHQNGADIKAVDNDAVQWASRNGHLETVKYLHENGAELDEKYITDGLIDYFLEQYTTWDSIVYLKRIHNNSKVQQRIKELELACQQVQQLLTTTFNHDISTMILTY